MPDPGAGNAETDMELTEQRASEERHDSSIASVQNARKERPGCLTESRHPPDYAKGRVQMTVQGRTPQAAGTARAKALMLKGAWQSRGKAGELGGV